jgi:hypothetical protein
MAGTTHAEQINLGFGDALCEVLDINGSVGADDLAC